MPRGWADYIEWQNIDQKMVGRVNALLQDVLRSPFVGLGKPEPLRENWTGWWSRRISDEHRIVYRVVGYGEDQVIEIAQCRFHYKRR